MEHLSLVVMPAKMYRIYVSGQPASEVKNHERREKAPDQLGMQGSQSSGDSVRPIGEPETQRKYNLMKFLKAVFGPAGNGFFY